MTFPPLPDQTRRLAAAVVIGLTLPLAFAVTVAAGGVTESSPAAPKAAAESGKTRLVTYDGDSYAVRESPQGTILTLSGNVHFVSDDSTLRTDLATYNRTTAIAESPGKLHLEDPKNAITGDKGVAYYKPREAKISGNVVITVKPKTQPAAPGSGAAASNSVRSEFDAPATITCNNLDYYWRTRVATITGGLTLKFKDYVVTADKAIFYANDDRIDLEGNIKYTRAGRQDNGATSRATILITEGHETLLVPAHVSGVAQVNDEESGDNGGGGKAPTPPPLPVINGTKPTSTPASAGTPSPATGAPTPAVASPTAEAGISAPASPSAGTTTTPPAGATSPGH